MTQRRYSGLKFRRGDAARLAAIRAEATSSVVHRRANALRLLAEGKTISEVCVAVDFYTKTVRRVAWNYIDHDMDTALFDRERRTLEPALSTSQKQAVVALCCTSAPDGRARWTIRLLAEEAVRRKIIPKGGRESIRLILVEHDLKPWRKKMWCVRSLDGEYVERMEEILDLYERAVNKLEPVVCFDERPVVLHDSKRAASAGRPGRVGPPPNWRSILVKRVMPRVGGGRQAQRVAG